MLNNTRAWRNKIHMTQRKGVFPKHEQKVDCYCKPLGVIQKVHDYVKEGERLKWHGVIGIAKKLMSLYQIFLSLTVYSYQFLLLVSDEALTSWEQATIIAHLRESANVH